MSNEITTTTTIATLEWAAPARYPLQSAEFGDCSYSGEGHYSAGIEIRAEGSGKERIFQADLPLEKWQFEQLHRDMGEACEMLRAELEAERKREPGPQYQGHKVVKVHSYNRSGPSALVELEGIEGYRCVPFDKLNLWTQGFILDEWRKRTRQICQYEDPSP